MSFLYRLLVVAGVVMIVALAVLPVLAQAPGVDVSVADLVDEVGCSLWRAWSREQARVAAINLADEVGGMLWRCWWDAQ